MIETVQIELKKIMKHYKCENVNNINIDKWEEISWRYVLSEDFIREFKDKISWKDISRWQQLSKSFIRKFKNKLDLEAMLKWHDISQKFYNELIYNKPFIRYEIMDFD